MIRLMKSAAAVLAGCFATVAVCETPAWITASNHAAESLLEVQAKYGPEGISAAGVEGHDRDILDLKPRVVARQAADLEAVATQYAEALKGESDPLVRQDLEILLKSARDQHACD
jgi:hypothetical protein